jgi:hypothetical protein
MKKRIFFYITICGLLLAGIGGVVLLRNSLFSPENEEKGGHFDYYAYTTAQDGTILPLLLSERSQTLAAPPFIYFESLKNAWFYLLLFSPDNKLTVLFPQPTGTFPRDYQFKEYFLPENNDWGAYLKEAGKYTLSCMVSTGRMKAVEHLLDLYAHSTDSRDSRTSRGEIFSRLQARIVQYRRKEEWIINTSEVPEWTDGTVRSNEEVAWRAASVPFRGIIIRSFSFYYNPGTNND